ncbi:caspase-3 [Drosophila rhopaloa]|uniref:Caspase-3 n=2 Tax=Drosophila rhopaloa TaxID=1041015 RepID=A0ABM5J265_DRORH|nr:caspase-3 [Drosophila rhopaloa]
MDDTDFSLFGQKNKHKKDKADATQIARTPTSELDLKRIIISRSTTEDTYENCARAGIALIFNHKDVKGQKQRVGTERDRDDMQATLKGFGFDVRTYDDLTFSDINDKLKEVAREDHSENDCFVLAVMSHGTEGKVFAKDMSYPVERLWNPFLGDNCKTLKNKPKLFFIQACRGENLEKAVEFTSFAVMTRELVPDTAAPVQPITYAIPSTADMLVFYSTFDKFFSFRNVDDGSWFIQSLCRVLDVAAANEASQPEGAELLRLLTAVNRKVAYEYQSNTKNEALNQMKEMPNFMSTLTKTFNLRVKPKT